MEENQPKIKKGDDVRIKGLVSAAEWNGRHGTVLQGIKKEGGDGRVAVRVLDIPSWSHKTLRIKRENLLPGVQPRALIGNLVQGNMTPLQLGNILEKDLIGVDEYDDEPGCPV